MSIPSMLPPGSADAHIEGDTAGLLAAGSALVVGDAAHPAAIKAAAIAVIRASPARSIFPPHPNRVTTSTPATTEGLKENISIREWPAGRIALQD
jgi:hypothetical protein